MTHPSQYLPPIARKCPSFVSLRSVIILLFKDRLKDPNSDTRATVVSAIRHSLSTSYSLLSVLTFSLMSDENLVRISLFW